MLTVFLLCLSWELVREELDGVHRRNERIYVVLCKVAAVSCQPREVKLAGMRATLAINNYTRSRSLWLTCPEPFDPTTAIRVSRPRQN
jgi:hypothetical protein